MYKLKYNAFQPDEILLDLIWTVTCLYTQHRKCERVTEKAH